jgi:hypothetical protein
MIPDACLPRLGSPRSFEVCLQEMQASPDRNGGKRGPGRLRADGLRAVRSPPGWLNWLVIAGIAWAQVGLGISLISDRTPRNLILVISIEASGVYALLLYLARRAWLPLLARRPEAGAMVFGTFLHPLGSHRGAHRDLAPPGGALACPRGGRPIP